jgi:hypothetical protein
MEQRDKHFYLFDIQKNNRPMPLLLRDSAKGISWAVAEPELKFTYGEHNITTNYKYKSSKYAINIGLFCLKNSAKNFCLCLQLKH